MMLMRSLGITIREISIREACELHFKDIDHDISIQDITYENSQARERTQILMDIANQTGGLVIGTGDLSELALGWATYNAITCRCMVSQQVFPKLWLSIW